MKMNQVVFVVIDHEEEKVLGVFNEYNEAEQVALTSTSEDYDGTEITITPVLVDTMNPDPDGRQFYLDRANVDHALHEEIALVMPDEDEDEELDLSDDSDSYDCLCEYEEEEEEEEEEEDEDEELERQVRELCEAYGVTEEDDQDDYLELARIMDKLING